MQKLKILIIGLETTGYETIHEILLTLTSYLGGAALHSAVVSLDQRDACLKQALFHPFLNRASLALEEEVCCLRPRESMESRFVTSSSMTCLRRASRELP